MRFTSVLAALLSAVFFAGPALADRYQFDQAHTTILFYVNHLGFSDMIGKFTSYDGYYLFDPKNPGKSIIDVTIKPEGIRTSSEMLDHELQTEKFFNSGKFPEIHFVSHSITLTGDHTGDIHGEVTMLGFTKPITLHVIFNKTGYHPITQDYVAGFSASATLKRSDFGMTNLVPMVGDEVRLEIQTEGIDLDRKKIDAMKKQ